MRKPTLIIMAGLPGTGKSTLARALAGRVRAHVLDKDLIRNAMFGPDRIAFTTEQDDVVMEAMLLAARDLLCGINPPVVIIDGRVFSKNSQLERVVRFADEIHANWIVIECVCPPEIAKQRIAGGSHIAANRTPELYDEVRRRFESIPEPKLVLNTARPVDENIALIVEILEKESPAEGGRAY